MRSAVKPWLVIAATVLFCALLAILGGAWVRSTYRGALVQVQAVADARRDLERLRADDAAQVASLLRYAHSKDRAVLAEYRRNQFGTAVAAIADDLGKAQAAAALPLLDDIISEHQRWRGIVDHLLIKDPYAVVRPASQRERDRANADMTGIRRALDARADEVRDSMSERLWFDVSIISFIAFALAAPTLAALILNRRLSLERSIANRLASAFGAARLPEMPGVELDAVLAPLEAGRSVGGDWYDARELPDGRLFVTIGDVAGHGIDAAVLTARLRRIMLGAAIGESDPARVLARVNDEHAAVDGVHVSTLCLYYDPRMRAISYASAGFPAPLVREGLTTRFLPYGGPPLGALSDIRYERHDAVIAAHGVVLLYSDGVIETAHDSIEGETRLAEVAAGIELHQIAHALHGALFATQPQRDDVVILSLRTAE